MNNDNILYKFFKGTLDNKIIKYKNEAKEDIKHTKTLIYYGEN